MKQFIIWIKKIITYLQKKINNFIYRKEIKKCKENPVYFINSYSGHNLYPKQSIVVNTINNEDCIIVKAPRQSGKSTVIQDSIVHRLIFNDNLKISLCSFNRKNTQYNFDLVAKFIENLPAPFNNKITYRSNNTISLDNGSSLTINDRLLYLADVVYYDEFALFSPLQVDNYFYSIGRKKQVIISTKKKGSVFDTIWSQSSYTGRFIPVEISFDDVPWFDLHTKEKLIDTLGQDAFDAGYT